MKEASPKLRLQYLFIQRLTKILLFTSRETYDPPRKLSMSITRLFEDGGQHTIKFQRNKCLLKKKPAVYQTSLKVSQITSTRLT